MGASLSVWLDLEETLINNWHDGLLTYHTSKIRRWLRDRSVKDVNIWSFAIWNDKDKEHFVVTGMKQQLEFNINCVIHEYPSVEDMRNLVHRYDSVWYESREEFMQLNGKHWSFIKFALGQKIHKHLILIDDSVPNMVIEEADLGMKIELINVLALK